MKRFITLALATLITILSVDARSNELDTLRVDSTKEVAAPKRERIQRINHIERDINKNLFIDKGEWIIGLTASYFTFAAEDADFLLFFDNIDASFGMTTIKPFFGYFYRNNRALGVRLGYSFIGGSIESARLDLGVENDIQIELPYISTSGQYFTSSVFHRSYTGLDKKGNFGLFAEVELGVTRGYSIFEFESGGTGIYTKSNKTSVDLSFNPGISAFIMNNVSSSVSFEFGGLSYTSIKQFDENGVEKGNRDNSSMRFKFNFLAINFGVTVHIW
ncbi:MAG: hypothetical protein SNG02_07585 [Rikenellaceae bacterium]